jgi:hypothetical protein
MSFLKRIFSSTPVTLVLGLAIIVIGLISVFTALFAISYYSEISISVGFIALIVVLIVQYNKFRKPNLQIYDWSNDSQKELKSVNDKLWKEELKLVIGSGVFVSIITIGNYWFGIITAPIIFFIYGFFCITVLYLTNKGQIDVKSPYPIYSKTSDTNVQIGVPRTLINYSIALVVVSAIWAFQIQKNESQLKQDGYSLLNEISDLTYCQDFQVNCVGVDSVKSVSFKKVDSPDGPGKVWEMCFGLNYEYSRFGGYYQSDYRIEDYCFSNEYYGNSWGQSEMESEIYKRLKQLGN